MMRITAAELKRLRRIERAAKAMIRAIDKRLKEDWPLKYVTPWRAATRLIKAVYG